MKKITSVFSAVLLAVTAVWLFAACGGGGGGGDGTDDTSLPKPSWIQAAYSVDASDDGFVQVTWQDVANSYAVYRRLGTGAWEQAATGLASETWRDYDYYADLADQRQPKTVQYAIKSLSGAKSSLLSNPSNPTAPTVLDVNATLCTESGKIAVSWSTHPEAQSYRLYRYANQVDAMTAPVLVEASIAPGATLFDDTASAAATDPKTMVPYYYQMTWVKDGVEYGKTDPLYALGAISEQLDLYEPNGFFTDLNGETSLFNDAQPPLMYVLADGYGGIIRDSDWYCVNTASTHAFSVTVTLPSDTDFASGELCFRFYYNGAYYPASAAQDIDTGAKGTNEYIFSSFSGGATGNQTVYFVVEPKLSVSHNVIGTYTVEINTGI